MDQGSVARQWARVGPAPAVPCGVTSGRAVGPVRCVCGGGLKVGRRLHEVKAHEKGRNGVWRTKDRPPSLRIKGLSEEGTASGREGHGEDQGPGVGPAGALGKGRGPKGRGWKRASAEGDGRPWEAPLWSVLFSVFLSIGHPP